jgi:hypothetical protein
VNAEASIRAVFESVLDDGTPYRHPNAPVAIVATKGRCVHVRLSGSPEWIDLVEQLIGDGKPCSEFRLEGRDLYARLKTPEQRAADDAAIDYDDAHGELHTWGIPDFEAPAKTARKKEPKRGPLEAAIAEYVEGSNERTFARLDLLADVREALERKGHTVRMDNLARCLNTRIIGTLLKRVPDTDGEQLELIEENDE